MFWSNQQASIQEFIVTWAKAAMVTAQQLVAQANSQVEDLFKQVGGVPGSASTGRQTVAPLESNRHLVGLTHSLTH